MKSQQTHNYERYAKLHPSIPRSVPISTFTQRKQHSKIEMQKPNRRTNLDRNLHTQVDHRAEDADADDDDDDLHHATVEDDEVWEYMNE